MNNLLDRNPTLAAVFVFIIIAATRILFINLYAVDIPWADQWDGEIERIYFKYLEGTLSFSDFWAQANEHRIILTKLLNLLSFNLSGYQFNQINALYLQSIIFSITPSILAYFVNRDRFHPFKTLLLILIFFPVIDWENAYWSYQSQVYFSILFGIIGAYFASKQNRSFIIISIITVLAGLANGAAFYIPALATCACVIAWKRNRPILEIIYYLSLSVLSYKLFTAATPWHDQYKADSILELGKSLLSYTAWPQKIGWVLWPLLGLQALITAKKIYVSDSGITNTERYGLFLSIWFLLFLASSTYARAGFPNVPIRYYAYYLVGFSAFLLFEYKFKPLTLRIVLVLICTVYAAEAIKDFIKWQKYSEMKTLYRSNFIETLRMVKDNPNIQSTDIRKNIEKLPLPYAGYPNYEVPSRIIQNPKSIQIFYYLLNDN